MTSASVAISPTIGEQGRGQARGRRWRASAPSSMAVATRMRSNGSLWWKG